MTFLRAAFVAACLIGVSTANAAVIGSATSAKNSVSATLGSDVRNLVTGDNVASGEAISTGADSAAVLTFLDGTEVSVAASSVVSLDQYDYKPDGSAQKVVITLTKGSMRFVTGHSDPANFQINGSAVTIGIHGTDFVVSCDGGPNCIVVATQGVVDVCPHPGSPTGGCGDVQQIDPINNFIMIGPNGTTGPQQISAEVVARLYGIVADGGTLDLATLLPSDVLFPLLQPAIAIPSPG